MGVTVSSGVNSGCVENEWEREDLRDNELSGVTSLEGVPFSTNVNVSSVSQAAVSNVIVDNGGQAAVNEVITCSGSQVAAKRLLANYLKCYYDQKITFIFSSDFETMFIKHSPSKIISLNFEKTVNLNCNFPV